MSGHYPPEAIEAAANRLMNALALHEDARDTVTDLLADVYEVGAASRPADSPAHVLTAIARLGDTLATYADQDVQQLGRTVADLARGHATIAQTADRLPWELDGLLAAIPGADAPGVHSEADAVGWGEPLPAYGDSDGEQD